MIVACIIPSTCSKKSENNLKNCISSLRNSAKNILDIVIIVVSENETTEINPMELAIDRFCCAGDNAGFSGMNNKAINLAFRYYIVNFFLLINDDVSVDYNFFREFAINHSQDGSDVVIPLVLEKRSHEVDSFGAEYFSSGFARNLFVNKTTGIVAPASCLMVSTKTFRDLKRVYKFYFNPILGYYFEDVEMSVRILSLNKNIVKDIKMVSYHLVSATSGKKSYFRTYFSYRNVIWLIIMNWPTKYIIINFWKIILVQAYAFIKGTHHFGIFLYLRIVLDTLKNINTLVRCRVRIIGCYPASFDFSGVLNKSIYRTKNDKYIL